jgi:hypothetical protein
MKQLLEFLKWNFGRSPMKFKLDSIAVYLNEENLGVRLTTNGENRFFENQTINEIKPVIEKNYKIVQSHLKHKIGEKLLANDLSNLSLKIVVQYFYMYNTWRRIHKKQQHRDLTFLEKDFDHPYTEYAVIDYFRENCPEDYITRCATIWNMTIEEAENYINRTDQIRSH